MKRVSEVMTPEVEVVKPHASLREVVEKMKRHDCGAIPVCDGDRLVGMITDRDIVLRTFGENLDPTARKAEDVMSSPIIYCFEDQDVEEVARPMEVKQIRRVVVLNRDKKLVGIASLGDVAVKTQSSELAGEILEKVSEPVSQQVA